MISKGKLFLLLLLVQIVVLTLLYRHGYWSTIYFFTRAIWKNSVFLSIPLEKTINDFQVVPVNRTFHDDNIILKQPSEVQELPLCPKVSPLIGGKIGVQLYPGLTLKEVEKKNPLVTKGGRYSPKDCKYVQKTAIIIPFRNREAHLTHFLYHMHPFLQRQQLNYGIYIIHQAGNFTFNRAKLLNVGFKEAMNEENWDCLYFHDVDLLPEDDRNTYTCESNPKHASVAMNKFLYRLPYLDYFGGVSALTPEQYMKMNGFPNNYWGWGGEDDDISKRVQYSGMKIHRPPADIGRYTMILHEHDKGNEANEKRFELFENASNTWRTEGMNNLKYHLLSVQYLPLYTNITADIGTDKGEKQPT
ncbi:beta-1,4-galactosyltransferase 3-like [Protopterus annectens]|uniref:beta-1,4-galactosyltransferase 3-like n=1 Tax=Protopterus annectens TaxID=7888 RepID=UPI001CFAE605|nr:beta-1,4-galactosyltransferase 3-like [Protopterus annectens]